MATESRAATRTTTDPTLLSAVENELPAYRAIPAFAIIGVLAGLASILCFAWLGFLPLPALAVLFGVLALRKIKQQPDIYTGRGWAQLGITLALIFGLSSFTYITAMNWLLSDRASKFARGQIEPIFNDASVSDTFKNNQALDDALWYKAPPERRRSMTPAQVRQAMDNPDAPGTAFLEQQAGGLVSLTRHLNLWPGAKTKFVKIERTGQDDAVPVAVALFQIDWPEDEAHDHADANADPNDPAATEEQKLDARRHAEIARRGDFVALILKTRREGRTLDWWVDEFFYPYKPASYTAKAKKVDDGHGH